MTTVIDEDKLKQIIEGALMAADEPLSVGQLTRLFAHGELDSEEGRTQVRETLKVLETESEGRGYELKRVASGYRYQVRQELSEWISRLWEEKPPRYSRALLETLALIAYRQPVTRGDIEQVRGVSVSQNIMRTLLERGWIRAVGQREVPGKPSLYGTTRAFLDYFDLKSLDELPPLSEIQSLIEPLVIEEVAEEAWQVAEHDHPELADANPAEAVPGDGASPEQQESAGDAASEESQDDADPAAQADESPEPDEDDAQSAGDAAQSAEVVRLPTSPRR
ncbi:MAG: SMC-Scp complex subunit ScpB [Gammaproteobacteria bacterium]|nr:SMC-Scp complex subunit ScpB [Gammaproteobacteria bacterium]